MNQPSPLDAEQAARLAWATKAKRLHANKRILGLAGIILGACILLWWKYTPDVPVWAEPTALVVLGVSWLLFLYVIIARYLWVKRNPPPRS